MWFFHLFFKEAFIFSLSNFIFSMVRLPSDLTRALVSLFKSSKAAISSFLDSLFSFSA